MEMQPLDELEDHTSGETPEDVAILYSWANLEGAKYRDFSANRREYRAQMRHRAAEQLRLMELRAQSEAEAAAAEAEAEAAAAHAEADAASVKLAASRTLHASGAMKAAGSSEELKADEEVEHMRRSSLREAAQQARRAAAERLEAARRAEAAALADSIARREEREIAEAQASALRQAAQYAESDARGRQKRTHHPENQVPGRISDPYGPQVVAEGAYFERPGTPVAELEAARFRQQREYIEANTGVDLPPFRTPEDFPEVPQRARPARTRQQQPPHVSVNEPDELARQDAAPWDESLTGAGAGDASNVPPGFEPRPRPKPIVEDRYLSIARDAHRLDEAGALHLRREHRHEDVAANRMPGAEARREVPSMAYKEFRRTNGATSPGPEVVSRIPETTLDEPEWRTADTMDEAEESPFREREPADGEPMRRSGGAGNEPWIPPTIWPVSESAIRDAMPDLSKQNGNGQRAPQSFKGPAEHALRPRGNRSESPQQKNGNGNQNGDAASLKAQPVKDSWGVAWQQSDPRVVDKQPKWSNRPEAGRSEAGRSEAATLPPQAKELTDLPGPAWLYPKTAGPRFVDSLAHSGSRAVAQLAVESLRAGSGQMEDQHERDAGTGLRTRGGTVENTLQHSREQVASRWFALKGVFTRTDRDQKNEERAATEKKGNTPIVVVYSMAGGVGKTSLVATLGRALSSVGEKVLLTDTTSQGLLPFYFGASELHPGVVRTFSPPDGSSDAPIHLVSYNFASEGENSKHEGDDHGEALEELVAHSHTANRVLMDSNVNSRWMVARLAWMKPTVLVPLAPDMNSVISLQAVERSFLGMQDAEGKPLQPTYLLNQFDASLPLHLDVREVLKKQLGDRLLPFVVRRASGVGEALAEGMTIVDYDPESDVAKDYMGVANWLRSTSAPATVGFRNLRWSER